MPIHPDNAARYPADWRTISLRIRTVRAGNRCECDGRCGKPHLRWPAHGDGERCTAVNGEEHPVTGSRVVLTVAHLDHTPGHCDDGNLMAMCQRCHLNYDVDHHAASRAARMAAERAEVYGVQLEMFDPHI